MEWQVIKFFLGFFWRGCVTGLIVRFLIAVFTKGDVTWKGAIRSALVGGSIYLLLMLIRLYEIS